ncbi:MAG: DUF58 domain-containing protein [Planctomycetia bacterium]|jgi:uncharacterized protein (DUF58 family)
MAIPQYFDPLTLSKISRLELRAQQVVEGFMSGMHRSPYFGNSIEFRQHREYTPGDDLRHIDWKVLAKQDRYYVKQYEEETNLRASLLVDVSASMKYGTGAMDKRDYAATIAVSLAYLLLSQQDATGCLAFDESVRDIIPQRTQRNHLDAIIRTLSVNDPQKKTDIDQILRHATNAYPRRGMMLLISDLLVDADMLIDGLQMLKTRGHDVMVFHVMDDDELDFPFAGPTRFEGLESLDHITCNPRALRAGYLEALQDHLDKIRHGCAKRGIAYELFRTSQPLDSALVAFLNERMRMRRVS